MSYVITTKGLDLLALVQADPSKKIEFVRAEIGNGKPEDVLNPEEYTSLIGDIKNDAEIQNREVLSDESVKINISYNNEFVETGFTVHEVGLYVKDPDDDTKDFLFLYCNSGEADFLPDNTSTVNVEQVVNLIIKMSNTENVTVTATSSSNVIRENFGDNTILKADVAGAPVSLEIDTNTILGRKGSEADQIEALTPEEARNVLNTPALVDGKISYVHNNISNSPRQAILSLNDISFKTSNVKIADEHSYVGNGQVQELDFGMDFVTQNSVNQFGGIAFGKCIETNRQIRLSDTDMNEKEYLYITKNDSIADTTDNIRKFTENGVEIGTHEGINNLNEEGEYFAFQTTKKEQKKVYEGVKSVVLKCKTALGVRLGLRNVEFYNEEDKYPLTPSDFEVFATSEYDSKYLAKNAFDTSLSMTGSREYCEWLASDGLVSEQKLIIIFNAPIDITHVVINNSHHSGLYTDYGVKDLEVIFTDQLLDASNTAWDTSIPNGQKVWSGRLSPHVAVDAEDPQTIMYTPWRYNPNNGFAFHTRTGRGVAEQIKNPPEMDGMKLCFRFSKNINSANNWFVYTDKLPSTQGCYLNLPNSPFTATYLNNDEDPDTDHYSFGITDAICKRGSKIKDYCFFGKDLSYIEPGLTGVEGATAFMKCDPGQTFDCGFEPQMIITKSLEVSNNWKVFTKYNDFKDVIMRLSGITAKYTDSQGYTPAVNGTKITAPYATDLGNCLIMAFAEVVSVPAENKVTNTLAKSSPGTLSEREVDMGMDFVSDENGGMVLTKGGVNNWAMIDTVRGPSKRLITDADNAELKSTEYIKEFTKNGIKVGNNIDVNGSSDQFYIGFQTDEKVKPPKWKAKSVIFDIAGNYGATDYIRIRSIEFYKDDNLLPFTETDFVTYSDASNSNYEPKNIFVTGKPKTGTDENNGWRSTANAVTNQRVVIVFNNEIEFDKLVINNGHDSGGSTDSGAKLVDIQVTDHNYKNSTYGAIVTGFVNRIFKSEILQHTDLDEADDSIYVDISDEWQINRASGFGMCKIKGTQADRVLKTPYGKEPCMLWIKNLQKESWFVYFNSIGESKVIHLNTSDMENQLPVEYFNNKAFTKDEFYQGKLLSLDTEYMIYAWFGDYFQDTAIGAISANDSHRLMGVKGTSAFFMGSLTGKGTQTYKTHVEDIETIIFKTRGGLTGHWNIINRSLNNFQDTYFLNTADSKQPASSDPLFSINGSDITVTTSNNDHDNYLFMVFGRTAEKDTKDYIPWMNQVNHVGTGETDTHIDLGMDFTGENGGMILQKHINEAFSWVISDTIRGTGKELHTDANNAEAVSNEAIKEFTENGIKIGTADRINKLNSEIATFAFNTTHKTKPTRRTVKSAIFKFADVWGGGNMGVRRIEFYKKDAQTGNDVLINLTESDFDAYATNEYSLREAKYAFITSNSKTGPADNTSWYTTQNSEQVLVIVFKTPKEVDYIRVDNFHTSGTLSNEGVKNTKVYFTSEDMTEDKYSNFSYTDEVPNSELVYNGIFDQHHASNAECYTQYLYTPWHYNPQTGFGFFTHKGNGTEITIENVFGKQPTMIWTKNLNDSCSWVTYSKIAGEGKYGVLDTNGAINLSNSAFFKNINSKELKLGTQNNVNGLNDIHVTYIWVGDDMATLGNPQEAYGVVGTSLFTELKSADSKIELGFKPEVVLIKSVSVGDWYVYTLPYSLENENTFESYLTLNSTLIKTSVSDAGKIWAEGTKLRFGSGWVGNGDYLIGAFAKNTYKPQGKSIVIHGSESKPSLFSIANGFNKYQAVDKLIGYDRNVVFSFNEGDGNYYIKLNIDGTITLKNQNCFYGVTNPNSGQDFFDVEEYKMFSPSGSVVPGIYIGKIVIQNDAILDIQKFQTGTKAYVDWFPVSTNSMYIKDNPFFTNEIDWDIWWNSADSDDNRRHVTGQYYNSDQGGNGIGGYKRTNSNELIIGTGWAHTFYSYTSGDPIYSNSGYYKLIIRRNF